MNRYQIFVAIMIVFAFVILVITPIFESNEAPLESFCKDIGMEYRKGYCLDEFGEKHFYEAKREGGKWIIGSYTYEDELEVNR